RLGPRGYAFPGRHGQFNTNSIGGGTVKKVGSAITKVAPGDKVLLSFASCGSCINCKDDHPSYCLSFVPMNFSGKRLDGSGTHSNKSGDMYAHFFGQSSFSRLTIANESSVVKVAPDTDLALFAPLGCGLQTGAGAVLNTLNVKPGTSLAVFGVGGVGMSAIMAAKIRKAKVIIAIDLQQSRLDLAKELGATHTLLGNDPELVDKIRKCTDTNGVNFAVDCSGAPPVVGFMVESLTIRGKAASVGAPSTEATASIKIFEHLTAGKEYVGCCEGDAIPAKMVEFLMSEHAKGNYPIEKLITYYPIKDFDKAVEDAHSGVTLKPVLKWD
ncbi:hypothetical protein Golomagni_05806, partial [Golovinomyces magnicellulatus]